MKKILLMLVVSFSSLIGYAQTGLSKGTILTGGNLRFTWTDDPFNINDRRINRNFLFSPRAGLFLTDRFVLGLSLAYGYEHFEERTALGRTRRHYNTYNFGLFARQYWMLSDKAGVFGEAYASLEFKNGYMKSPSGAHTHGSKSDSWGAGISPGVVYFLTDRLGLEAIIGSLSFHASPISGNSASRGSVFSLDTGLGSFTMGLQYYFTRKKSE